MNLFPSFIVDKRKYYAQTSTHLFLIVPKAGNGVHVSSNSIQVLLLGLCLGITFGIALIPLLESDCDSPVSTELDNHVIQTRNGFSAESRQKSSSAESFPSAKMLRPRFYSTELGLRKKLVAGIIVTDYAQQENLVAINKTLAPFVNQLLFFVVGQEASQRAKSLGLGGVVTLTFKQNGDFISLIGSSKLGVSHYNHVGLMAIKYLGEKLTDHYDFFFLGLDFIHVNGRNLQKAVNQFTISQDVFWGDSSEETACSLEKGLVYSRSILRKLSVRLDRCFVSTMLKAKDSLKNCYQYTFGSLQCSETLQAQKFVTVSTTDVDKFSSAISIGPVSSSSEMYWIHLIISKNRDEKIDEKITNLSAILNRMNLQVPEGYQTTNSWPPGIPNPHRPQSRFDVLKWKFFTSTNLYPQDDHITDVSLKGVDKMDVSLVINNSALHLSRIRHQRAESFSFQYGYRRLDETRGMEYILDFLDSTGTLIRTESLRPISKVEIVPMPFVTENRRVTIVVPVTSQDLQYNETDAFLTNYFNAVDKNSNSVVVIAIVMMADGTLSPSDLVKLQNYKRMIALHNTKHNSKNDSDVVKPSTIRAGHVIVNPRQLFKSSSRHYTLSVFDMLSNQILSSNTLVLALDVFVEIKEEFLNRCRINTILNSQIFSPMPFIEYDPKVSGSRVSNSSKPVKLEIHKSTGYFDPDSFNFISFFIGDYLTARKQSRPQPSHSRASQPSTNGILQLSRLFLDGSQNSQLHFLRAPEPTLIIRFDDNLYSNCSQENRDCLRRKWGSKASLAKLILDSQKPMVDQSL